jgi:hypothetical protein
MNPGHSAFLELLFVHEILRAALVHWDHFYLTWVTVAEISRQPVHEIDAFEIASLEMYSGYYNSPFSNAAPSDTLLLPGTQTMDGLRVRLTELLRSASKWENS